MRKCRLEKTARLDLDEIAQYISLDDVGAALRVIDAILATLSRIERNAEFGNPVDDELKDVYYLQGAKPARSYVIVYQIRAQFISVIGLFHASRDWQAEIRRRLHR